MNDQNRFGRGSDAKAPAADPVASARSGRPVPRSASDAIKPQGGVEPPRKRRKRASRNQLVVVGHFFFSLFIFALIAMGALVYIGNGRFEAPGPAQVSATFLVRPGANVNQIANGLQRGGLITSARLFVLGVRVHGHDDDFKAGEYGIAAGASMRDIMRDMVDGTTILHPLTIVEGMTVHQALQRIAENDMLSGPLPARIPAEGMLIADTQRFTRGTGRIDLINRMVGQQRRLVEQIWERRGPDLPIDNINEFVTLASIVEKETALNEERPRVAGVFINRLRRGMRLQSDPTFIYGLFGGEGKPQGRPIYRSDIDSDTPYNTYRVDRLPPGPIAIPGRASLEAVANPARTDELYFVADGTGGHAFARTYEQHNANVRRWREIEQAREKARQNQASQQGADAAVGD